MKNINVQKRRKGQKGFTLVELAVVMIIVGLLIGGILKGQELITNAQVAATIAQAKGIDAAVSTFRDSYRAIPGDMANANTRLADCTAAPCSTNGNGDGRISTAATPSTPIAPDAIITAGTEASNFFVHLATADLISGVQNANNVNFGEGLPETSIGGGYTVGFHASGTLGQNTNARGGHYLAIRDTAGTAPTAGLGVLTAAQASRIDTKMDDGDPTSGSVFSDNATNCTTGGTPDVYDEANNPLGCYLYVRIQS
ncbi:MAG: type II secretion system protein [Alphaproteobacteria bacterium]